MTAIGQTLRAAFGRPAPPTYGALLADLSKHGLVARPLDDPTTGWADHARLALAREAAETPHVAARIFVGIGTWIGAALIGFVIVISGAGDSSASAFVFGALLLCAAAFARRKLNGDVAVQVTLALLVGAQCFLIYALDRAHVGSTGELAFTVALQAVTIAAIPDALARFLATIAGMISAFFLAHELEIPGAGEAVASLAGAYVLLAFLYEARLATIRFADVVRPVAFGLVAGIVTVLSMNSFDWPSHDASPLATIAFGGLLLVVVAQALVQLGRPYTSRPGIVAAVATLAIGALGLTTPGLLAALFLVALGHLRGERLLELFALAALGWFLFLFFTGIRGGTIPLSLVVGGTGAVVLAASALAIPSAPRPPSPA
jgi:hypothetical protein